MCRGVRGNRRARVVNCERSLTGVTRGRRIVEVMFPSTTCGDAVGESEVAQLEVVAFKHKEPFPRQTTKVLQYFCSTRKHRRFLFNPRLTLLQNALELLPISEHILRGAVSQVRQFAHQPTGCRQRNRVPEERLHRRRASLQGSLITTLRSLENES